MTLYTSDTEKKRRCARPLLIYTGLTLFCVLFSAVYESFSHGVFSDYMVFLFLFPLVLGIGPFGLLLLLPAPYPDHAGPYHAGVAALTVGSCFAGVLEIYGTQSDLLIVYWIAGSLLLLAGLSVYLGQLLHAGRAKPPENPTAKC